MSTGVFMGIRSSFADETANEFLKSINRALRAHGYQDYFDPDVPPSVYNEHMFGRSALDHHASRVISETASLAGNFAHSPQLRLVYENPYRLSFVPANLREPLRTDYSENISGRPTPIYLGSLPRLHCELQSLAKALRIPLEEGKLADSVASAINEWRELEPGDSLDLIEDRRTAWLLLFEGSRLALANDVALSLAG